MKKLIVLAASAFAVIAGTVTVMTIHPQHAAALACTGNGC